MEKDINQFETSTGAERLGTPKYVLFLLVITALSIWVITHLGVGGALALVALPFILLYFYWLFRKPITGLWAAIVMGFVLLGFSRYIDPDIQVGLGMDIVLVLTYVAFIFRHFYDRGIWKPAKKEITLLAAVWFGYSILEFFNPEAQSHAAWFSGMRGISLYMMLIIPLDLLFIDNVRKLDVFFTIWGIFSILASLKGIMQITLGPDPWEQLWLSTSAGQTHIIWGQLRAFSFMSDAGQFGANQAYSAVMAVIVAFADKNRNRRIFFLVVAALGFAGMFLSGTRGAISIPLAGFAFFFILRRSGTVLISGMVLLAFVFVFFKITYIGQDNTFIRRMRSAFNPNDPSLLVRIENQKKLSSYLATRPFGGGIGNAGVKAKAYSPDAFLSNIATDSWYVLIWAEQGIVGLALHLFILFYILIKSSYRIMFRIRDPVLKLKMSALASGMMGVMVASYGNAVLGTMPTSLLIYTSMALMLNSSTLDVQTTST
jgi:hypothetical protein